MGGKRKSSYIIEPRKGALGKLPQPRCTQKKDLRRVNLGLQREGDNRKKTPGEGWSAKKGHFKKKRKQGKKIGYQEKHELSERGREDHQVCNHQMGTHWGVDRGDRYKSGKRTKKKSNKQKGRNGPLRCWNKGFHKKWGGTQYKIGVLVPWEGGVIFIKGTMILYWKTFARKKRGWRTRR